MKKPTLTEQLLLICVSIIFIVIISLGIVLPRTLLPVYEENLYNYLNQSLSLLEKVDNNKINSEIAYIYIDSDKGNIEPPKEWYQECTPTNMIKDLKLRQPIYEETACFGHFGCPPDAFGRVFSWERS